MSTSYQGIAQQDEEQSLQDNRDLAPGEARQPIAKQSINPETLRIFAYLSFWAMVAWAMLITKLTVEEDKITHSALVRVFGYNNICIFWDYNPAIWATALIYPAVEFPLLGYVVLNWLRTKKAYQGDFVSLRHYRIATVLSIIEFILFAEFRMIFVNRAFETISGHTAPFTGFQFALTLNAIQNLLFYGYTDKMKVYDTHHEKTVGKVYLVVIIVVTAIKQYISWTAICKEATSGGICHSIALDMDDESNRAFATGLDRTWMVLLAIIPLFIAVYTRRKSASLELNFNLITQQSASAYH